MRTRHTWIGIVAAGLLCASVSGPARAEEVEKKLRVGFSVGGYDTQSAVRSDAANTLYLTDDRDIIVDVFSDPRNDSAAIGDLKIEPAVRATASLAYAFHRFFLVEVSAGYQKGDVGQVEVQAEFAGIEIDPILRFNFIPYRIRAGEMTQIPIQLSALVRFRPKADFNPYLGLGAGYTLVGFDPSDELNQLSANMDRSAGGLAAVSSFGRFDQPSVITDLDGATVSARDTFEWHGVGGLEYTFRRKWAAFVELRYVFASREFGIQFNGSDQLGVSVPDRIESQRSEYGQAQYGPYLIARGEGGLIDGGSLQPLPGSAPDTDCEASPASCEFDITAPDGVPDPGYYYVRGGSLKYGGFALQIGVKYTF